MKLQRAPKRRKVEIMNPEFVISIIYAAILIFIVVLWTMDTLKLSRRIKTLERTISENHIKN
jgi:cell division protein FtsL